jgi:signal transduction histidine kinase
VQQIRSEAAIHAQIYSIVQQGMLRVGEEGAAALALMDLQQQLGDLDVPIVAFNAMGEPYAAENLPFDADLGTAEGREELRAFADRLAAAGRQPHRRARRGRDRLRRSRRSCRGCAGCRTCRWAPAVLLILVTSVILRAQMRAQREQLWSAMARELAHQMATPLSSLSGWVEVIQLNAEERDTMVSPERIGHVMQADVERLERVSRRFELIGKPQALELVSARAIIDELVSYFQPRLPHLARGIRLRSRVHRNLPAVRADRVLLVWALENILKNAVDALAGRGGRISVMARHGPGAPPAPRRAGGRPHHHSRQRSGHCADGA